MNELIEKISASFEALKADAELQAEKGNKAAGTRKNAVEPEVASNIDILFLYPIVIFKTLSFITIIEV